MAPTIGRVALDNGFHGSIPRDWVAPPPQNIQQVDFYVMQFLFEQIILHNSPSNYSIPYKEYGTDESSL